uniref:Sfi1 spindle body domain-containing protein n=1 Tax=Palpitomonas bilix TaxID=652834 RepID=A0A7S3LVI1_9EUKA
MRQMAVDYRFQSLAGSMLAVWREEAAVKTALDEKERAVVETVTKKRLGEAVQVWMEAAKQRKVHRTVAAFMRQRSLLPNFVQWYVYSMRLRVGRLLANGGAAEARQCLIAARRYVRAWQGDLRREAADDLGKETEAALDNAAYYAWRPKGLRKAMNRWARYCTHSKQVKQADKHYVMTSLRSAVESMKRNKRMKAKLRDIGENFFERTNESILRKALNALRFHANGARIMRARLLRESEAMSRLRMVDARKSDVLKEAVFDAWKGFHLTVKKGSILLLRRVFNTWLGYTADMQELKQKTRVAVSFLNGNLRAEMFSRWEMYTREAVRHRTSFYAVVDSRQRSLLQQWRLELKGVQAGKAIGVLKMRRAVETWRDALDRSHLLTSLRHKVVGRQAEESGKVCLRAWYDVVQKRKEVRSKVGAVVGLSAVYHLHMWRGQLFRERKFRARLVAALKVWKALGQHVVEMRKQAKTFYRTLCKERMKTAVNHWLDVIAEHQEKRKRRNAASLFLVSANLRTSFYRLRACCIAEREARENAQYLVTRQVQKRVLKSHFAAWLDETQKRQEMLLRLEVPLRKLMKNFGRKRLEVMFKAWRDRIQLFVQMRERSEVKRVREYVKNWKRAVDAQQRRRTLLSEYVHKWALHRVRKAFKMWMVLTVSSNWENHQHMLVSAPGHMIQQWRASDSDSSRKEEEEDE